MSRALRYGLMGAVSGGLQAVQGIVAQNIAEAKSERLRQARMAEQAALAEWEDGRRRAEKAEDRAYAEQRDEKNYERQRADKAEDFTMTVEERKRQEKVQAEEAAKGRAANIAVADRYAGRSAPEAVARVIENLETGEQRDLAPGEPIPEGFREVRAGSRYAPSPVRQRQERGGKSEPADKPPRLMSEPSASAAPADAPAENLPPRQSRHRGAEARESLSGAEGKPGSSKQNPARADAFTAEPPPGTWVLLPNGRIIQTGA